jgi:mxaC protein
MPIAFDRPWVLVLLLAASLPLMTSLILTHRYSWSAFIPADRLSWWTEYALKGLGTLALACLAAGLAGPYIESESVERLARGARIALLLDRSASMDNTFAGNPPAGGEESKGVAARRLLTDFVRTRTHDLYAVAAFSTAPLMLLKWSSHREAVESAVATLGLPGLAFTHVAKGLAMALSFFDSEAFQGSRALVLVSDGAAVIDRDDQERLRRWFQRYRVALYWVFLRTANGPGLFEPEGDPRAESPQAQPERFLHTYFQTLGVPYRAYEAEDPAALAQAIADISRLESLPMRYTESLPRRELAPGCFALALAALSILLLAHAVEVRAWH